MLQYSETITLYTRGVSQQFVIERYLCANAWKSQPNRGHLSGRGTFFGGTSPGAFVRTPS